MKTMVVSVTGNAEDFTVPVSAPFLATLTKLFLSKRAFPLINTHSLLSNINPSNLKAVNPSFRAGTELKDVRRQRQRETSIPASIVQWPAGWVVFLSTSSIPARACSVQRANR